MSFKQSKYAIAQINIPIEIFPDGDWTNHNDRMTIEIIPTSVLPPISDIENQKILETIQQILGSHVDDDDTDEDEYTDYDIDDTSYDEDEPITKISFNSESPSIGIIKENNEPSIDISSQPKPATTIEPPKIRPGMVGKEDTGLIEYIDKQELLNRPYRTPSKNTSFRKKFIKNNKTRSNKWIIDPHE